MNHQKALKWDELTAKEITFAIDSGVSTAFLPFGSTEQHGPHLVTGYDTHFAERLSLDLAKRFGGFLLPSLAYGMAEHHLGFVSTIHIRTETLLAFLSDIALSLQESGIQKVVIVNGHGGNYELIQKFAQSWNGNLKIIHDADRKILFSKMNEWGGDFSAADCGLHGGLFETSMAMYTHPGVSVRESEFLKGAIPKGTEWTSEEIRGLLQHGLKKSTLNGVVGNPIGSNRSIGEKFYNSLLDEYVKIYQFDLG
jgi:creatinine amidohydrolase